MINELISMLIAIREYAKDIHYTAHGEAFYGKHLLADRIADGYNDFIDSVKENILLGQDERPLSSKEYLKKALNYIPVAEVNNDEVNFKRLQELIEATIFYLNEIKSENRGVNKLLDDINDKLLNDKGLINLQIA